MKTNKIPLSVLAISSLGALSFANATMAIESNSTLRNGEQCFSSDSLRWEMCDTQNSHQYWLRNGEQFRTPDGQCLLMRSEDKGFRKGACDSNKRNRFNVNSNNQIEGHTGQCLQKATGNSTMGRTQSQDCSSAEGTIFSFSFDDFSNGNVTQALATGDVTFMETEQEIIDAALKDIDDHQQAFHDLRVELFNLNTDGSLKDDNSSLTSINWYPTTDGTRLDATFGVNFPVLTANATFRDDGNINSSVNDLAVAGEKDGQRYLVLPASPQRTESIGHDINDEFWGFYRNSIQWLTQKSKLELETSGLNVVVSQHRDNSSWFRDDRLVRAWLADEYGEKLSINEEKESCDNEKLSACIDDSVELLILSNYTYDGSDDDVLMAQVERANALGIPVLFTHYHRKVNEFSKKVLSYYSVKAHESSGNYYSRLALSEFNPSQEPTIPASASSIQTLLTHLRDNSFTFDISSCSGGCVSEEYQQEFKAGADELRTLVNNLDSNKVNIFESEAPDYQKLSVLLADFYRLQVLYPMSYDSTDTKTFLSAYYADHVIHNYRIINPSSADLGDFSRTDFSHIIPDTKGVELVNIGGFRSTGAYALPGQTVTIRRNGIFDEVDVKVFVNTMRSGSTKEFNSNGYTRPKYLRSQSIPVEIGEVVQFTSPYGGPIQVEMSGEKDLPIALLFSGVGEHPHYPGFGSGAYFESEFSTNAFDWAEIVTPNFEIHSTTMKMAMTLANPNFTGVEAIAEGTKQYVRNFPHVLAGFKGAGIDVVPEIVNWAENKGLELAVSEGVKHMNADKATCGSGCSGNPYDANWAFNPLGHGDIHELGHGLEKKRLRFSGYTGHSSTNYYSYYSKSQFFTATGTDPGCQNLNNENFFEHLQESFNQPDPHAYMASLGLGSDWRSGPVLYLQIMMLAEQAGTLTDGWNLYPRLHIILREFDAAVKDDELWNAKSASLGFSHFRREDANALSNDDWLAIAIANASSLNFNSYLEMWGRTISDSAKVQVEAITSATASADRYFRFEKGDYCKTLDWETLPLDGETRWLEPGEITPIISDAYNGTLALSPVAMNWYDAEEFCHSHSYVLPTSGEVGTWRNMYSNEQHEQNGITLTNYWTSTANSDGRVPYRRFHTSSGGASSKTTVYNTVCLIN